MSCAADTAVRQPVLEETAHRADPAAAVGALLRGLHGAAVLAVSGGRDSMALMRAAAETAPDRVRVIATFDHGTGPHAAAGTALVMAEAATYGFRCYTGCGDSATPRTEAAWRDARWQFLRAAARGCGARAIVTAHTRDDHIETIVMRVLRHAGARGMAALDIDGDIVRPWLRTPRRAVAEYATRSALRYVEDPSNTSRAHLRNRIRLDLLPALRGVCATIDDDLVALAGAAAAWRRTIERIVHDAHPLRADADGLSVAAHELTQYDAASLRVVWPVLAAQAGITLDRRGTARVTEFTHRGRIGSVMQLSGGFEVQRSRFSFVLRRPGTGGDDRLAARARGLLSARRIPSPTTDR